LAALLLESSGFESLFKAIGENRLSIVNGAWLKKIPGLLRFFVIDFLLSALYYWKPLLHLGKTMIKFQCSNCGKNYRVTDEYAGKRARCKDCGTVNVIPSREPETVGCGDSIAAYNNLLHELLKFEKQAPPLETEV
jgi:DNA-directed RNA polymerase subunit RPC12/RpoP